MGLQVQTDDRGRLVATVSSRPATRVAGTAVGAGAGALGAALVLSSMSAVGRWWLVPVGILVLAAGGLLLVAANRVDRWVFDGGGRRVERYRAALVPLEPTTWPLDDVLEVSVEVWPDADGDAWPSLTMRLRSGERIPMFGHAASPDVLQPAGGAAATINAFLGTWR